MSVNTAEVPVLIYGFSESPNVPVDVADLGTDDEAVYFIGRERVHASDLAGMALWREHRFVLMYKNDPTPSTTRPCDSFCNDHADIAITVGPRGNAIATEVPTWILRVAAAPSARS